MILFCSCAGLVPGVGLRQGYDRDKGDWYLARGKQASLEERRALVGTGDKGLISWYGGNFQGKLTASGEIFDKRSLTAAHRTYPFGTVLKVTLLKTGRAVRVVVNDRGPYSGGRILDLSEAAAREVGLLSDGVGEAHIEVVE